MLAMIKFEINSKNDQETKDLTNMIHDCMTSEGSDYMIVVNRSKSEIQESLQNKESHIQFHKYTINHHELKHYEETKKKLYNAVHHKRDKVEKILIGTDLSDAATEAMNYAFQLVRDFNAKAEIVYIVESLTQLTLPQPMSSTSYVPLVDLEAMGSTLKAHVDRLLDGHPEINSTMISYRVVIGEVVSEILQEANRTHADLIVLGNTGKNTLLKKIFGSTARDVAHKANIPVLLVPPSSKYTRPLKICYTFTDESSETLNLSEAIKWSSQLNADISFLYVSQYEPFEALSKENLFSKVSKNIDPSLIQKFHITHDVIPEKGIERFVKENQIDLIILVDSGKNKISSFLTESVSKNLEYNADFPLLILHRHVD
jgi:nucleotide-binding universal stress UspA family protein